MLESEVNLKFNPNDISLVHRIGKKTADSGERKIVAKFVRRDSVDEVFKACSMKKPDFFANCSLTPTRNKIFYAVRNMKKSHPNMIASCRAVRGEVTVFVPNSTAGVRLRRGGDRHPPRNLPPNKRMVINTRRQLEDFAESVLKTNLDLFNINR